MAIDKTLRTVFAIADAVKEDRLLPYASLMSMGIEVIMLTGDHKNTAEPSQGRSAFRGSTPKFSRTKRLQS